MPDERMDSMLQGIGVPPESPAAAKSAAERRAEAARQPAPGGPPPDSALGGTSDAESAGDEARMNAAFDRGLASDRTDPARRAEDRSAE